MNDFHMEQNISPVFKLADPTQQYKACMKVLGAAIGGCVNMSKLKSRLLLAYQGTLMERNVILTFDDGIGTALNKVRDQDTDHDAMHLACAPKVL